MINLKKSFPQYRIVYEPSGLGRRLKEDDIALQVIPCVHGHVYAWSDTLLAASLDGLGGLSNRLRKLGEVAQDGDDGITVLFPPDRLSAVVKLLGGRRGKQAT